MIAGVDQSKMNDVLAWYRAVPHLVESVQRMAWEHRQESPFIVVQVILTINLNP
jgi:hypothetical protein